MAGLIITIDGPAASGKSTAAGMLAKKLDAVFLDTGAMYRALTLAAMEARVTLENQQELLALLEDTTFEFDVDNNRMCVKIDEKDVTERIREPEVTANARHIASAPKVREKLIRMQRQFAAKHEKIVTEGRDQGTVAFPDANIKFYLTAEPAERARRRQAQLQAKGTVAELEQLQKAIEERDNSDTARAVGPLTPADDAIIIDTTAMSIDEVVDKLVGLVREKCLKND